MGENILVVDDETDIRELLALKLERAGYKVFQAANGEKAFLLAREVRPSLIITDVVMSPMNGNQFLKKLRASSFGRYIPLIVITARANMKDYFEIMEVDDFIAKPFDPDLLLERIAKVLKQAEERRSLEKSSAAQGKQAATLSDKRKVLILENDKVESLALLSVFEDYGYEVKMVTTPSGCLEEAILFQPNLIISKFLLDGMNADKLIGLLRGMPPMKTLPIIIYSHMIFGGEQEIAMKAGASAFLADVNGIKLLKKANELLLTIVPPN